MKYLLDTMVVSEPARREPHAAVLAWLRAQSPLALAVSVLTIGEIRRRVDRMADGRRRAELARWLEGELRGTFRRTRSGSGSRRRGGLGMLTAEGDAVGRPLAVVDGLLLATAKVHGLTMVTRNVADFAGRGVPVHDPYRG